MFLLLSALAAAASRLVLTADTPVSVFVDGLPVAYAPGTLQAVADGLPPGTHGLVLADGTGRVLYAADITLPDHAEARTRWRTGRFGLVETVPLPVPPATLVDVTARMRGWRAPTPGPALVVTADGTRLSAGAGSTPEARQNDPPSVVELVSVDGEWANVRIDGALVAELRNADSQRKAITLEPGPHTVEVRSFMDDEVWAKGILLVGGGGTIKIGIAEGKQPEVYNRAEAWTPEG